MSSVENTSATARSSLTLAVTSNGVIEDTSLFHAADIEKGENPLPREGMGLQDQSDQVPTTVIGWDGPDDPENPLNWKSSRKWAALLVVASMCFLSPLASTIVAPAAPAIANEFGIVNKAEISLIVSVFVLGYAVGPLLASPLSEIYGRSIVIQGFMMLFLIFNIACAVSQSAAQIIIFRFITGCGGSAPIAVGVGTLSDCFRANERGRAMSFFSLGILLGPIAGPLAGAWLVASADWRWAIWLVVIVSGLLSILSFFIFSETFHPILIARKAARIAKETNSPNLKTIYQVENADRTPGALLKESLVRPFALLFTSPLCAVIGGYMAICWLPLFVIRDLRKSVHADVPREPANLHYLAPGIGLLSGSIVAGFTMDKIYMYLSKKNADNGKPEYRIPLMAAAAFLIPVGLLIYGWTAQYQTHWIAPDIGVCIFCVGVILSFLTLNTYIVDSFQHTASAIAATTVLRSLAGFLFPLFGKSMFDALGLGWGNTLLALVAVSLGSTYPVFLWFYGPRLRPNKEL